MENPANVGEIGGGSGSLTESSGPDYDSLQRWFEEYETYNGDQISSASRVVKEVCSDEFNESSHDTHLDCLMLHVQVDSGLCRKCRHIFDNVHIDIFDKVITSKDPEFEFKALGSFRVDEIEASAKKSCRFCGLLFQMLKEKHFYQLYRRIEARLDRLNANAACSLSMRFDKYASSLSVGRLWLGFPGKLKREGSGRWTIDCEMPSSKDEYIQNPDTLALANIWLHDCLQNHEHCRPSEQIELPTRLIALEGEVIRLTETANWTSKPQYCALSHAWGNGVPFKLTAENYDSLLSAIPLNELPRTFVESIEITRKLGVAFLWIDSLCIIQDDQEDWRKEASTMSAVYGGSTITLAASSARDSSEGFFLKPSIFSGGVRLRAQVNGVPQTLDLCEPDHFDAATTHSHLATRAWALQERLLSQRLIHLGDRGAVWECRQKRATEYLPEIVGYGGLRNPRMHGRPPAWSPIVEAYCAASLSVGRDKLVALAGIAQKTFADSPDEYMAGLWRTKIIFQLRWYPTQPRRRPPYRAPSWSWASIDGEVKAGADGWQWPFQDPRCQTHAFLWDYQQVLSGKDPFGGVDEARLRLTCALMAACRPYEWLSDSIPRPTTYLKLELFTLGPALTSREHAVICQLDCIDDDSASADTLYMLPLVTDLGIPHAINEDNSFGSGEITIFGLLLQPTGFSRGEFRRVGSFNLTDWDSTEIRHLLQEKPKPISNAGYFAFMNFLDNFGDETAKAVCTEIVQNTENPDYPYLITIV